MDAFLLDTSILSIYLDTTHKFHAEKKRAVDALPVASPRYVSAVALAELTFGARIAEALGKGDLPALKEMIRQARKYAVLDITHHTSDAYAELKAKIAVKYLASPLRKDRPKFIEDWIDRATGKALGIDENDLWMCAQAKERDLVLTTTDGKIQRIRDADSHLKLLII